MLVWHLTADATRSPARISPHDWVALDIGSWPVEPGQAVWADVDVEHADGTTVHDSATGRWLRNVGENSYWRVELPPFARGDRVTYRIRARSAGGGVEGPSASFRVGPKLYLALMWHQHQPLYKDVSLPSQMGSYLQSAVRCHSLRDYYSMAALVADYPALHLTINLTPSLLSQIEDYVTGGATDRALELTRIPAEELVPSERGEILRTFFDADPANQVWPHPRYAELLALARDGHAFGTQEVRDLQMWFNLAWFAKEFRDGDVRLVTGEVASVRSFVEQQRDYTVADVEAMVAEQYKILRAVLPIHRALQDRGQVEVATSAFYHPILPLLVDSDSASLDRPGTTLPPRFAYPDDADAQVRLAVESYTSWFGVPPRGIWPAEGAVSQAVVPIFARHGVRWVASDRGVLALSGRWGYRADEPEVFCQPYRVEEDGSAVSIFFRDGWLSDHIGFHYQRYADYGEAARDFLQQVKERYALRLTSAEDRVLTVVLDGENAWSAYREDARPFLRALYELLEHDAEVETVTFSEYLEGSAARSLDPHPPERHPRVYDLYAGSWADETGSAAGVDLGTWIGEPEENEAWALLGEVREHLRASGSTPESAPSAFRAMYAAEGSDWFWWLGADQESGRDPELDQLFHAHLRAVYHALGELAPRHITPHAAPPAVVWTPESHGTVLAPDERLLVRTSYPGFVSWRINHGPESEGVLMPVRNAVLDLQRYQRILGPFPPGTRRVLMRVRPTAPDPSRHDVASGNIEDFIAIDGSTATERPQRDPSSRVAPMRAGGVVQRPPASGPEQ